MLEVDGLAQPLGRARRQRSPQAPPATASLQASSVVHPAAEQPGQRGGRAAGGRSRPCACSYDPLPLVRRRASSACPPRARARRASRSPPGACGRGRGSSSSALPARLAVGPAGERLAAGRSASSASLTRFKQLVVLVRLGREVAEVLVDPVRRQRADDVLVPPVVSRASPRATPAEMFQSSCTSWSSKIIAVETVESSQRMVGSPQLSR